MRIRKIYKGDVVGDVRMVKIELGKGDFVWIGLLIVLVGVGFVYGYGGTDPSVMGHSAGEVGLGWSDISGIPAGFVDGVDNEGDAGAGNFFIGFTDAECVSAGGSGSTTETIISPYWGSIKICKTRRDTIPSGWALIGYYHDAVSAPSCYSYQSGATPDGWNWYAIDDPSFRGAGFPFEASPFLPTKCPACSSSTGSCTIPAKFQEISPKITSDSSCINTGWRTVDVYCRNIKWQKLEFDYVVISK